LIKEGVIEKRGYQEEISKACLKGNTLVCLPTGLGKSIIAALVAAERLRLYPEKKVIVLAPSRPLVIQHYKTFKEILRLDTSDLAVITGQTPPDRRVELWRKTIIFSTPQAFMNDLISSRVNISDVVLLVFDEAHRATGDYAYTFIAERYLEEPNTLILGLTASPGSSKEDVDEVCRNLFIKHVEVRSIFSPDVKPYVCGIHVEWRKVVLPQIFHEVKKCFKNFLARELRVAREQGFIKNVSVGEIRLKDILEAKEKVRSELKALGKPRELLHRVSLSLHASIHAIRAIELLETQGFTALKSYFNNLTERAKARLLTHVKLILSDSQVKQALTLTDEALTRGLDHPKVEELVKAVNDALQRGARRVIVFTNYRSTSAKLVEVLGSVGKTVSAARLVGQMSRERDRGLSQKEQIAILDDFKAGKYNVLVATQIGEEGLDIAECDEVIFYDNVPSAIRFIQRRGRTGRKWPGKVTVLMAAGTRDEAYYWIARRREKIMLETLKKVESSKRERKEQPKLEEFIRKAEASREFQEGKVKIIVDTRESGSAVVKELAKFDLTINLQSLEAGDFIVSDRLAVERKTVDDFAASIIDGRLFNQVISLKNMYEMPMILLEGETFETSRDIRPESMMGAVASILVDYNIPVLWARNPAETALLLYSLAKREQLKEKREPRVRAERKPIAIEEMQEFIVASLPNIDAVRARRLLEKFKTVEKVFTASCEELTQVPGIGEKISKRIRDVLTSKYGAKGSK
jgi:Fanconi anemia group M protein